MRILTVRQPWAWAIIHGGKDVENRVRNLAGEYRGPIAIHAGLQLDKEAFRSDTLARAANLADAPSLKRMPRGVIIGVVDLVGVHQCQSHRGTSDVPDCVRSGTPLAMICSSWAEFHPGEVAHHLVVTNPRALDEPIPFKGALGMRTLPADVVAEIERIGFRELTTPETTTAWEPCDLTADCAATKHSRGCWRGQYATPVAETEKGGE